MEIQYLQYILTALVGVAAFFFKRTLDESRDEIKQLKQEVQNIKSQYLHRDDFREFKAELRSMFEALREDLRTLQSGHCPVLSQKN